MLDDIANDDNPSTAPSTCLERCLRLFFLLLDSNKGPDWQPGRPDPASSDLLGSAGSSVLGMLPDVVAMVAKCGSECQPDLYDLAGLMFERYHIFDDSCTSLWQSCGFPSRQCF